MNNIENVVQKLIESIREKRSLLEAEATRLRTPEIIEAFDKYDQNAWCVAATGDSLIRLRLFTEQNFNYVEPMGLISVARYILEMCVWLELFKQDSRYGLVYYSRLLDTQRRYYKDWRLQIDREVALLKEFEQLENEGRNEVFNQLSSTPSLTQTQNAISASNVVSETIDRQAARRFSIYAEQAKTNGYGYQAYLVENKAAREVDQALTQIEAEQAGFDAAVPKEIKDLVPQRWNWETLARKVGMSDEYDFIYRYSSKLLHATPASITTDQKNLEIAEFSIFLKFIDVKIDDVLDIARDYSSSGHSRSNQ